MTETQSQAIRHSLFRMSVHTEIELAAEPEAVWAVLTDFAAYQEWNPAIPSAEGEAVKGTQLRVLIHWPDLKPGQYTLEVLAATAPRELRWLGHFLVTGLMDGDHSFIIESVGEGRVRVVQKEDFSGLIVPMFAPWLRRNILQGFEQINTALKGRVEQG